MSWILGQYELFFKGFGMNFERLLHFVDKVDNCHDERENDEETDHQDPLSVTGEPTVDFVHHVLQILGLPKYHFSIIPDLLIWLYGLGSSYLR